MEVRNGAMNWIWKFELDFIMSADINTGNEDNIKNLFASSSFKLVFNFDEQLKK